MDGAMKVIDMLGNTITQMEQTIAQQQQTIEILGSQLEAATKPAEPIDAKQSIKEPESSPSSP